MSKISLLFGKFGFILSTFDAIIDVASQFILFPVDVSSLKLFARSIK